MADQLVIDVDIKGLLQAFKRLPKETSKELRVAHKKSMQLVQKKARSKQYRRYTRRSGELIKATGGTGPDVDKSGLTATLELKMNMSPYARRIHEGGGGGLDRLGRKMTNRPDQFLYKAFEASKKEYRKSLSDAIGRAIKAAGL